MNFWHNANQEPVCCIRIRWPENQICNLIALYRRHPCLWNRDHSHYLDYCERRSAYRDIFQQIKDCVPSVNLIEVIVKLREVRKYYVNELRKIAEAESNGCAYESRYAWFGRIHEFLRPHLHLDELADVETGSTCSSNYCDETTASPRSRAGGSGLSELRLASVTPTKNSEVRFNPEIPASQQSIQLNKTNSRLTERKSCDRFDLFAKGVACRLRRMSAEVAAEAQTEIQRLLTDFEAFDAAAESNASDADVHDCDCEVILPFSRDRKFMAEESNTNYTI